MEPEQIRAEIRSYTSYRTDRSLSLVELGFSENAGGHGVPVPVQQTGRGKVFDILGDMTFENRPLRNKTF